jgi:hypothetical protein
VDHLTRTLKLHSSLRIAWAGGKARAVGSPIWH